MRARHTVIFLVILCLSSMASAQSLVITESLRLVENCTADVLYSNEFGEFKMPESDELFPYSVIRMELEGDVKQAKAILSLDVGYNFKVVAKNINKNNLILFLVPSDVRSIYLQCGDGCSSQQLYFGTLLSNRVYNCHIEFNVKHVPAVSSKEGMAEIAELRKQIEQMKLLLNERNNNTIQEKKAYVPVIEEIVDEVVIEQWVLKRITDNFQGEFVIANGVKAIDKYVFRECTGLTGVKIPFSLTSIGNSAFAGCTGLTSVVLPNSVESIGSSAFSECTQLANITLPNSVTSLGNWAFYGCSGLTDVNIQGRLKKIEEKSFGYCTRLTSITLPNCLESIGNYAFDGCIGLTDITLPDSLKSIESYAFNGCSGLSSITIPRNVTSIGDLSFQDCTGLVSVDILSCDVTFIGENSFKGCNNLSVIYVPKGLKKRIKKLLPDNLKMLVTEK